MGFAVSTLRLARNENSNGSESFAIIDFRNDVLNYWMLSLKLRVGRPVCSHWDLTKSFFGNGNNDDFFERWRHFKHRWSGKIKISVKTLASLAAQFHGRRGVNPSDPGALHSLSRRKLSFISNLRIVNDSSTSVSGAGLVSYYLSKRS